MERADLQPAPDDDMLALASLTELLGGDTTAQQIATLVIAEEQMRVDPDPLDVEVPDFMSEIP